MPVYNFTEYDTEDKIISKIKEIKNEINNNPNSKLYINSNLVEFNFTDENSYIRDNLLNGLDAAKIYIFDAVSLDNFINRIIRNEELNKYEKNFFFKFLYEKYNNKS